ncbi:cell division protein FtsA [Dehalogenimonas sp. 4OHTPN]|uniref:Cell division protein FtsA n=1 Tax=Dehalogenimonas sp. 4OHTPN TaxID=3166643 RepID=A0AAU8G840_9CHLR
MKKRLSAIDVGTTKVCAIMADADEAGIRILGVGVVSSRGLQKGMVVNLNEARESIRKAVSMAEQTAGFKMASAIVNITGRHIHSANNRGVIAISRKDEVVKQADVNRALEVARNTAIPADRRLLHLLPLSYTVDGQEGVKSPVGMHGFKLEVETHMVTASATAVENLSKCIKGAGVEIDEMIFSPLACAEAVISADEMMDGIILADIGGGTTDIAVFKDGKPIHTSVLPVAGYQITHDISVGLGVSWELAEEIKLRYGSVMPVGDAGNDQMLSEGGHSFPQSQVSEIIRSRVEEMVRLALLEVPGEDYQNLLRGGMVLTGGSANLPGLAEMGQEVARLPVRIGAPPAMYGVSERLTDPAFTTSVGLIMWRAKSRTEIPVKPISGSSESGGGFFGLFKRK